MEPRTHKVINEVLAEREQQDAKWGYPQKAMRNNLHALAILAEEFGEAAMAVVEIAAAESNFMKAAYRSNLRQELIQDK